MTAHYITVYIYTHTNRKPDCEVAALETMIGPVSTSKRETQKNSGVWADIDALGVLFKPPSAGRQTKRVASRAGPAVVGWEVQWTLVEWEPPGSLPAIAHYQITILLTWSVRYRLVSRAVLIRFRNASRRVRSISHVVHTNIVIQ